MSPSKHFIFLNKRGFTLLELMFALILSMVVISFIIQTYLRHIQDWSMLRDHLTLERKRERLIAVLREQIKLSGHLGGARLTPDFPILSYKGETYSAENKLIVTKQHHLIVRGMNDVGMLLQPAVNGTVTLITSNKNHWKTMQRMIIADCEHGEIVEVKTIRRFADYLLLELSDALQSSYEFGASIGALNRNELYLDHDALFIKERKGRAREIIPGLSRLSFHLSEQHGNRHLERLPEEVQHWSNVEGMAVDFQLQNETTSRQSHLFVALANHHET